LNAMLGKNVIHTVTDESTTTYPNGFINEAFLKRHIDDFSKHFYLCGPPKMVEALQDCLKKLGARPDAVIFEK
jgi:NAD(P)H-flavin reductase